MGPTRSLSHLVTVRIFAPRLGDFKLCWSGGLRSGDTAVTPAKLEGEMSVEQQAAKGVVLLARVMGLGYLGEVGFPRHSEGQARNPGLACTMVGAPGKLKQQKGHYCWAGRPCGDEGGG